jgi:prevent-host-death family protein
MYLLLFVRGHRMATTITSREFNQDTSRAKKAARGGPVFITDRGRPGHVLLTFDEYERLVGAGRVVDLLGEPPGIADVELPVPTNRDIARPASLD